MTEEERKELMVTTKRIKLQEEEEEEEVDRISLLPDCLIVEILCRLESTKEAITTGALSKRWLHLWQLVPSLFFNAHEIKSPREKRGTKRRSAKSTPFFLFVDKTLTQRHQSKLNKFQLQLFDSYDNQFESRVKNWIRYAINCNVQHLHLASWNMKGDQFVVFEDDSFFINSHFTHLHLENCFFIPTGEAISWKNLKSLFIANGNLDEHLIAEILSGSPLLDTLCLFRCYGYRRLDITSKSVKNLVFSGYSGQEDGYGDLLDIIEINAPYISSLTIQDDLYLSKLLLLDVSSLVEVFLNYKKYVNYEISSKEDAEEMLKSILLNLRHVKDLSFGITCYSVLYRLEAKGFKFPSNAKVPDVTSEFYDQYYCDSPDYDTLGGVDWMHELNTLEGIDWRDELMLDNVPENDEVLSHSEDEGFICPSNMKFNDDFSLSYSESDLISESDSSDSAESTAPDDCSKRDEVN